MRLVTSGQHIHEPTPALSTLLIKGIAPYSLELFQPNKPSLENERTDALSSS